LITHIAAFDCSIPDTPLRGGGVPPTHPLRVRRLTIQHSVLALLRLGELNGGDWPLAFVTFDGNLEPVEFIKPNVFHRPGLSIA